MLLHTTILKLPEILENCMLQIANFLKNTGRYSHVIWAYSYGVKVREHF